MEWGMPSLLECEGIAQDRALWAGFCRAKPGGRALSGRSCPCCGRFCTPYLCEGTAHPLRGGSRPKRMDRKRPARRPACRAGAAGEHASAPERVFYHAAGQALSGPPAGTPFLRFRDACAAAAGEDSPLIALESTRWPGMQRQEEAAELLLQAPCFALCYDAGHDRARCALLFYRAHMHLHLHDAAAQDHLFLGEGDGTWKEALHAARQAGVMCAVIEVKTAQRMRESIRKLREYEEKKQ